MRDAHRAVEEGVGFRARRPHALVEAAEHDPVDVKKPRLEQAEDLERGDGSRAARR